MPADNLPATGSGAARYYGGSGTSGGGSPAGAGPSTSATSWSACWTRAW